MHLGAGNFTVVGCLARHRTATLVPVATVPHRLREHPGSDGQALRARRRRHRRGTARHRHRLNPAGDRTVASARMSTVREPSSSRLPPETGPSTPPGKAGPGVAPPRPTNWLVRASMTFQRAQEYTVRTRNRRLSDAITAYGRPSCRVITAKHSWRRGRARNPDRQPEQPRTPVGEDRLLVAEPHFRVGDSPD